MFKLVLIDLKLALLVLLVPTGAKYTFPSLRDAISTV